MTKHRGKLWALLVLALGGVSAFAAMQQTQVEAADHLDPPHRTNPDVAGATADRHADIADVYTWVRGTGASRSLVTILSFSGPNPAAAGQAVPCDANVEYSLLISNNADLNPEFTLTMRLGADDTGHCFYQVSGVPGVPAGSTLTGLVQHATQHGTTVQTEVGLFDDAFFFDLTGFRALTSSGHLIQRNPDGSLMMSGGHPVLQFQNDRDFFAGQNTSAWIVELPLVAVSPSDQVLRVWATTARHS